MTPSQLKLADRLAEYLQDKWRPGMLHASLNPDGEFEDFQRVNDGDCVPEDRAPVLDDGPTKGALLAMVRERYKAPNAVVLPRLVLKDGAFVCEGWRVYLNLRLDPVIPKRGTPPAPTEGEALALALLEAP